MIFSSGLGLSEEEVAASLNPQTIAANEGNSKLAQAVADELSSRGYPAWVEESCGNLTWTGMVPPCSYIIHAQGLETYASYSGDMYEQRNARDEALRIIGDATGYYPQGEYPSTVQVSVPTQVPTLTKSVAATTAVPASTATPSSAATGQPVQQTVLQQTAGAIERPEWEDWLKQNLFIALGGAALLVILLMGGRK